MYKLFVAAIWSVVIALYSANLCGAATPISAEAKKLNEESSRFYQQGQYQKAVESLQKALVIAPEYADAHNNLALSYLRLGEGQKALASANKAVSLSPQQYLYHRTAGLVHYKNNNLDLAISSLKKAIELGDKEGETHSVLGNAYFKKDMIGPAIAAYEKALQINPSLTGARNNLERAKSLKK